MEVADPKVVEAQRLKALVQANQIRTKRRDLKRELGAGRDPVKVLRRPPTYARGMKLTTFLQAIPGIGKVKIHRVLTRFQIGGERTLEALTRRERDLLIDALERKDWGI